MADQLLKTVRITDNIKLELYQQGKRRKYSIFNDVDKTRSQKYDVTMSDNDVIKESLLEYGRKLGKSYTIIQDPYKDPFLQRIYGSDKYPYYLNNGCSISIKYVDDKIITFNLPKDIKENGSSSLVWTDTGLNYNKNGVKIVNFSGTIKDSDIINSIISDFKLKVSNLHGVSMSDYDLRLCEPDTETCSVIPYKSPLEIPNNTLQQTLANDTPKGPSQSTRKIKLSIDGIPNDIIKVKAKEDLPIFTIWAGSVPKSREFIDQFDDLNELDSEYLEDGYNGPEETGVDIKVWRIQGDVSNGQEDCSKPIRILGAPVNVKMSTSYDQLMEVAGQCARELGKNTRVNAENLKMSYKKGIHGLCPQGTQATLYALTGVKSLGLITGNADWFSFKSPTIPSGGDNKGDFSKTGYYHNKVKISQINGSWKGTYLTDKSQWQVGDVIAMGYIGKSYGHIQCYTGYCWQSDFRQNAIQVNSIDPNSVALWRLNEKGIQSIKNLS